jgi:GPH family glycoside/pentoside/hexuronide:cation symporter
MGWPGVGLAIGIVSAIFAFLSLAGSHEKPEFKEKTLPILQAMRSTFSNRSFVIFVSYNFMVQYIIAVALGALPFFVAYVVGGEQTILFLILFLVAMPVFAVWNHINVTRGPRASAIITLLWVGIVMMGILFINDFTSALIVIAIAAAGVGGFMILPDILISFTIDADELKTGVRREGAYFGFNAFVMRFSVIAQSWTYGLLLNASGFDENLPVQPPSAILAIRLLLSIVPLIAAIIGAVIISRYPFHGQAFKELQQQIEVLHTQKKEHTS